MSEVFYYKYMFCHCVSDQSILSYLTSGKTVKFISVYYPLFFTDSFMLIIFHIIVIISELKEVLPIT